MDDDKKVLLMGGLGIVLAGLLFFAVFGQYGGSGPRGVWRSLDGGINWEKINLVSSGNTSKQARASAVLDGVAIREITTAPDRNDVLYLTTSSGIYGSDNGGQVWHHILPNVDVYSVKVANSDPNVLYVAGNSGGRGAVWKSLNRGVAWEQKYVGSNSDTITAVAVNPYDANDVWVGFNSGVLLNSRDGGAAWASVRNFDTAVNKLEFRPNDPRSFFMLLRDRGLFLTRDRANSFTEITTALGQSGGFNVASSIAQADTIIREDFRYPSRFLDFSTSPSNLSVIYMTTDTGLFATSNLGTSWRYVRLPVDPAKAQTVAVRPAAGDRVVYVSIDTIVFKSIDSGRTFSTVRLPTNRLIGVLSTIPADPDIVYAGMR